MRDKDIDNLLREAADARSEVDPALLDRISKSVASTLTPARPLAPAWMLAGGLMLIWAGVALTSASLLGLNGIRSLTTMQTSVIFPALGVLAWIAASMSVAEMTPGSARRFPAVWLPAAAGMALAAIFAVSFHDYSADHFVPRGIPCLVAGLLVAIPAGIGSWLILRRGFAVEEISAGLVAGTLASLAGVAMLELHCANLEAAHVLVWHTGVVPVAAAAGAFLAWVWRIRRSGER